MDNPGFQMTIDKIALDSKISIMAFDAVGNLRNQVMEITEFGKKLSQQTLVILNRVHKENRAPTPEEQIEMENLSKLAEHYMVISKQATVAMEALHQMGIRASVK